MGASNLYVVFPGHGYLTCPVDVTAANGLDSAASTANLTMGGTNLGAFDSADVGSRIYVSGLVGVSIADGYYTLIAYDDDTDIATIKGESGSITFDGDQGAASGFVTVEDFYKFSLGEPPDFVTGSSARARWLPIILRDGQTPTIGYSYDYLGGLSSVDGMTISMAAVQDQPLRDVVKYTNTNLLSPELLSAAAPAEELENSEYRNIMFLRTPDAYPGDFVVGSSYGVSERIDELRSRLMYPTNTAFELQTTVGGGADTITPYELLRDYTDWGYVCDPSAIDSIDPNDFPYNGSPVWIEQEAVQLLTAENDDVDESISFTCRRGLLETLARTHIPGQTSALTARCSSMQGQRIKIRRIPYDSESYTDQINLYDGYVTGIVSGDGGTSFSFEISSQLATILTNKKQDSAPVSATWDERPDIGRDFSVVGGQNQIYYNEAGALAVGQDYAYVTEDTESPVWGAWRWVKVGHMALKLRGNPIRLALATRPLVDPEAEDLDGFLAPGGNPTDYNLWNAWDAYRADDGTIDADEGTKAPYFFVYPVDRLIRFSSAGNPAKWDLESPWDRNSDNFWDNGAVLKGFDSFEDYAPYSRVRARRPDGGNKYPDITFRDSDEGMRVADGEVPYFGYLAKEVNRDAARYPLGNGLGYWEIAKDLLAGSAISAAYATNGQQPEMCHIFEPVPDEEGENEGGKTWTWGFAQDRAPASLSRRDDSYVVPIHIGEMLLQVLTSTEGYIGGRSNGRFDVLPPGIGLGIPAENVDVGSFLDPRLPILINAYITGKDIPKISDWFDEVLKPYGLIIKMVGTTFYLMSPETISVYELASKEHLLSIPPTLGSVTDTDLYHTGLTGSNTLDVEYEYIFNTQVSKISHTYFSIGREFDTQNLRLHYKSTEINTLAPERALLPNGSKIKKDLSFEVKFNSLSTYYQATSVAMMSYTAKPLLKITATVRDPYGIAFEPTDLTQYFRYEVEGYVREYLADRKYWPVRIDLSNVVGSDGSRSVEGYGIIVDRKWDLMSETSEISLYLLFTDSEVEGAMLSNNNWAFSFEVGSGATATTLPYNELTYDVGQPDSRLLQVGDSLLLYDKNFILRSTDPLGDPDPREVVSIAGDGTVTIASTFNGGVPPITANEGDIVTLATRADNTDFTRRLYSYLGHVRSFYTDSSY